MIYILISSAIAVIVSTLLGITGFLTGKVIFSIIAGIIFMLAIGCVIGSVIVYFTTKDDYKKALIFIDSEKGYNKASGMLIEQTKSSMTYGYSKSKIVIVPNTYGIKFLQHKRVIGVSSEGHLIANPLGNSKPFETSENTVLIQELVLGHIGADMIRAVSSSKFSMNWIIIAIIAVIIGASSMMVYNQMQKRNQPTQQPAQTQPVQPAQPQADIIIIEGGQSE